MTAQVSDIFILDGEKYSISGVNGGGLFIPEEYGLQPVAVMTSCWNGYVAAYTLQDDDILVLENLSINLSTKGDELFDYKIGPEINGKTPTQTRPSDKISSYYYQSLSLPINFTGGILVCQGFIPELYVHMGFHPAWKYEKVIELLFDKGKLTEKRDVSDKIKEIRDSYADKPLKPKLNDDTMLSWIDSCFRLDYQL